MPFICPLPFTLESDEKQDVRGLHTTVARTKYGGYHHSVACFEFEYSNSKIVCMHNYRWCDVTEQANDCVHSVLKTTTEKLASKRRVGETTNKKKCSKKVWGNNVRWCTKLYIHRFYVKFSGNRGKYPILDWLLSTDRQPLLFHLHNTFKRGNLETMHKIQNNGKTSWKINVYDVIGAQNFTLTHMFLTTMSNRYMNLVSRKMSLINLAKPFSVNNFDPY